MKSNIVQLPTQITADAAWEKYQGLMRRWQEVPELQIDRDYCEQIVRAWADYRDAFIASEK